MSSAVAMAGLFVAVASQRSQLAVQIMMQYSERFRTMLEGMPAEVVAARHGNLAPEPTAEITKHTLAVFFVLLELHYLREKRYLPAGIWNLWLPIVRGALESPLFVREWQVLRSDFVSHASFCRFVESLQK